MRKYILEAHAALKRVYGDKSYSDEALGRGEVSAMTTKLTYGVLEKDILLEYILGQCVSKKPRLDAWILLKIGAYSLLELSDMPAYAIVSECVESAKVLPNVRGASGFVNAVLKRVASRDFTLPAEGDANYLSVTRSVPQWFIDRLVKEYGATAALATLDSPPYEYEHARANTRLATLSDIAAKLSAEGEKYELTEAGGIGVKVSQTVKSLFASGKITYQSASSMLAVQAMGIFDGCKILDMCSAPGGKSVYMSELDRSGSVVACELHSFRLKQIQSYCERMRCDNVLPVLADGTKPNPQWKEAFDFVLVDAPCTCFGTYKKHPDVFIQRGEGDISKLAVTQKAILKNAAEYVKRGGVILYSTCTLFDEENRAVVNALLTGGRFVLEKIEGLSGVDGGRYCDNDGSVRILPHGIYDGFYIAKLRRKK